MPGRSLTINLPQGQFGNIARVFARKNIGILIIQINDFETEDNLLNPLSKSILQFSRLLLDHDYVTLLKVRSPDEIGIFWASNHGTYTHIILIGHGKGSIGSSPAAINFGAKKWISVEEFSELFQIRGEEARTFISLCCKTGQKSFAGKFSNKPICKSFIAPEQAIHGAEASQYCQTYLAYNLLKGYTEKTAYSKTTSATKPFARFNRWINGKLKR